MKSRKINKMRQQKWKNRLFGIGMAVVVMAAILFVNRRTYAAWVHQEDGTIFYQDDSGQIVTGFRDIDDKRYYFDEQGFLKTGKFYVKDEDAYYYSDDKGVLAMGEIVATEDGFYCVDETGKIQKGFVDYNQARYYFDENANMVKGWFKAEGNWYYTDNSGKMVTGLTTIDGYRYYFDANGVRVSNTVMQLDGVTYVFNEDGSIDENASALYPAYQSLTEWKQSLVPGDFRQDSKVQACAILRAGQLKDGFMAVSEGEMETLLKNRGVKCNKGYEFSYGGVEGYSVECLIRDMAKDSNVHRALQDESVTAVGIGMDQQETCFYYDVIFICE